MAGEASEEGGSNLQQASALPHGDVHCLLLTCLMKPASCVSFSSYEKPPPGFIKVSGCIFGYSIKYTQKNCVIFFQSPCISGSQPS